MLESAQNPRLKAIRALHSRKHRESEGRFLLETTKLVVEAVKSGWPLDGIYCTENWFERHRDFTEPYEESDQEILLVSEKVFGNLTTLESPEGVVAIARYPREKFSVEVSENSCFALAVGIQDPGNLGTLIRTADAAGATAV
ncbi:MAG TPA: RNA methyltransferase substrate-binding domain-containing protein, partial [Chroococcales cyanobacterium]